MQSSSIGQKAAVQGQIVADRMRQLGEVGVAKAKEAMETGRIKLNEMQQQKANKTTVPPAEQLQLQPGATLLPTTASAPVFSPVEPVQKPLVRHAVDSSFSSIPDSSSASTLQSKPIMAEQQQQPIIEQRSDIGVRDEETEPLLHKQISSSGGMSNVGSGLNEAGPIPLSLLEQGSSGDPLPATVDQSSTGTGAEWDGVKQSAMPQVAKAKSLYSIWKEEDKTQSAQPTATASKPVQQQAAEMYAKGAEVYSSSVKPALSSGLTQAQTIYKEQLAPLAASTMAKVSTVFNESVQPRLSSTLAAAQEQAGVIREDGLGVTMDKAGKAYQRRVAGAKQSVIDTYEEKVSPDQRQKLREVKSGIMANLRLGWNKALDVWEAQEPTLRAWTNRATATIKRNKLELPLLFLGALVALWVAMSLVGWAAFPNKAQTSALPALYQPRVQPSTGPIQGANLPTLTDKLKMKLDSADEQLRDTYGSLRDSGAQQLNDLKGSVHDLKARVASSIPNTNEVKGRAADAMPDVDVNRIRGRVVHGANDVKERVTDTTYDIKDRVESSASDIKERVESGASEIKGRVQNGASDIKGRMESGARDLKGRVIDGAERVMDSAADLKDRVVDAMPSMRDVKHEAAHLKERMADGIDSARAAMPSMPAAQPDAAILTHLHTDRAQAAPLPAGVAEGDIALKVKDRLHHATHAVPDGLRELRAKVAGLKDSIVNKLSPASHSSAPVMHNDVLDPDQHVVEEMDSHKHVKESIQI